jgi:dihydroflavonol-4-reductase
MTTTNIDPPSLILVTGATGYMAGHVIKQLLEEGYRVRGTVRNVKDVKRYQHLTTLINNSSNLEFVEADLLHEIGWKEAVQGGVQGVIHMAMTVFKTSSTSKMDPRTQYLEPALTGINNVIQACKNSGTVKRIVFTSSATAVSENWEGWNKGKIFGPNDFNTTSTLEHNAYGYAKVQAEKRLIDFCSNPQENTTGITWSSICPYAVLGPSLSNTPGDNDIEAIARLLNGGYPMYPPLNLGVIDVRDTAIMHVKALRLSQAGNQRFIATTPTMKVQEFVTVLEKHFPEYKSRLPHYPVSGGIILLWMTCFYSQGATQYMRENMGKLPQFDTSNVETILQFKFRPPEETIVDSATWLIKQGFIHPPGFFPWCGC